MLHVQSAWVIDWHNHLDLVSHVMQENMTVMTAAGMTFKDIGKEQCGCLVAWLKPL